VFVQLAFLEQLLIPNAHSSISTHVPAAVSWYPAIQVHTEESALVIVQIAPLPQLHSRTAVVVDGILDDVKDGDKVDEITCDTEILAFCGAVALAFGSGEAVAFRGTAVLAFCGATALAFGSGEAVAFRGTPVLTFCGAAALAFGSGEAVAFRGTPVLAFCGAAALAFGSGEAVAFRGTPVLVFCGAAALAFGSGEAVAFRGTPVLSFGGEDPVAFCCAAVVAFCREAVVVTWAYVKRYAITLLQTVTAEEDNIWRVEQY
jgi:hypothetical protein